METLSLGCVLLWDWFFGWKAICLTTEKKSFFSPLGKMLNSYLLLNGGNEYGAYFVFDGLFIIFCPMIHASNFINVVCIHIYMCALSENIGLNYNKLAAPLLLT